MGYMGSYRGYTGNIPGLYKDHILGGYMEVVVLPKIGAAHTRMRLGPKPYLKPILIHSWPLNRTDCSFFCGLEVVQAGVLRMASASQAGLGSGAFQGGLGSGAGVARIGLEVVRQVAGTASEFRGGLGSGAGRWPARLLSSEVGLEVVRAGGPRAWMLWPARLLKSEVGLEVPHGF